MAKTTIRFKNINYTVGKGQQYPSINALARALKVNVDDLKAYKLDQDAGNTKRTFVKPTGESIVIDIAEKTKPLILRNFGIKRIPTNKQLIKRDTNIVRDGVNISLVKDVSGETQIKVFISGTFTANISDDIIERKININRVIRADSTREDIRDIIVNYINNTYPGAYNVHIDILNLYRNAEGGSRYKTFLGDMVLRDDTPIKISNIYSNVIEDTKWKHCIHDYMISIYRKQFSRKQIEKLNTTNDIYDFCVDKNIKMVAYDMSGECIKANYPTKQSKYKSMLFIAHNNHLYPITNNYLKKVTPQIKEIVIVDDIQKSIIDTLKLGRFVGSVCMDGDKIISACDGNIKYIMNKYYNEALEILTKFGIADKIYDNISTIGLGKLIHNLYVKTNDKSVFINHTNFIKGGFNYENPELNGTFKSIDRNKSYSASLRDLPYLIKVDMISDCIQDNVILDEGHYLYIAKPAKSTILMPDTNCYSGDFLKYCHSEGIKFEILEKMSTIKIENHYTEMINDLYKKIDNKTFKMTINAFIGQFESSNITCKTDFVKWCNDEELKTVEGYKSKKINENLHCVFKSTDIVNIYNRKPISIQIKDEARKQVYLMMKSLKLSDSKIKSIHTDSISYIGEFPSDKYIGSAIGQWKIIEYKDGDATFNFTNETISFKTPSYYKKVSNNVIGLCYAGCGKTYKIINEYIPTMGDDYIVVSPSYASLTSYKLVKLNSTVIQTYEYNPKNIKEHNIIIDEIGMVSRKGAHQILEWIYSGHRVIAYGDHKQLLPVNEVSELNGSVFISLFDSVDIMTTNYRNNFTKEEYDAMINGTYGKIEDIINKYNNSNSNNIIAYRNSTCNKYNKIIAEKLNIKDKFSVGAKVIINTNELRHKDKTLFNRYVTTIIENDGENVTLENGVILSHKEMNKKEDDKEYVSLAYARTLHSFQGAELTDFYFPPEDIKFVNNRFLYTLISRLKTK